MKKVLIVDDNEADHFLTKDVIETYDSSVDVLHAYDGKEGLEVLQEHHDVDIILLDINMPGMNGLEFLEHYYKMEHSSVVVAMLTSSDQEDDKKFCQKYDFVKGYFIKPITLDDLQNLDI